MFIVLAVQFTFTMQFLYIVLFLLILLVPIKGLKAKVGPDFGLKSGWGIYYFTHTAVCHPVKNLFLSLVN